MKTIKYYSFNDLKLTFNAGNQLLKDI